MNLIDVTWTNQVNILTIECDCGTKFNGLSSYSQQQCPTCLHIEYWHGVSPKSNDHNQIYNTSVKTMKNCIRNEKK